VSDIVPGGAARSSDLEQPASPEILIPGELAVLPIFNTVIYPLTVTPLAVGQEASIRLIDEIDPLQPVICLVALRSERQRPLVVTPEAIYTVGTAARVHPLLRLPDGTLRIAVEGLERVALEAFPAREPYLRASVRLLPDEPARPDTERLAGEVAAEALELLELLPGSNDELRTHLDGERDPRRLGYLLAASLLYRGSTAERQALLALGSCHERLARLRALIAAEREALLRAQAALRASSARQDPRVAAPEIGQGAMQPDAAGPAMQGAAGQRWSDDIIDLELARRTLDSRVFTQEYVKRHMVEYIAARELRRRRLGSVAPARAPILCLCGPTGTGKTTLAAALAQALGRQLARISIHTIPDAAGLLGRAGGAPGAALRAIRAAGTANPVLLLDDLDGPGLQRPDVLAALLELTDPLAPTLYDRAAGTAWDLGPALLVAATRDVGALPSALRERLALIALHDYDAAAKRVLIERFLLPAQLAEHAIDSSECALDEQALTILAEAWPQDAGVTALERTIAAICRRIALALLDESGASRPYIVSVERVRTALASSER
jgi:ATP-dependent Lon protease